MTRNLPELRPATKLRNLSSPEQADVIWDFFSQIGPALPKASKDSITKQIVKLKAELGKEVEPYPVINVTYRKLDLFEHGLSTENGLSIGPKDTCIAPSPSIYYTKDESGLYRRAQLPGRVLVANLRGWRGHNTDASALNKRTVPGGKAKEPKAGTIRAVGSMVFPLPNDPAKEVNLSDLYPTLEGVREKLSGKIVLNTADLIAINGIREIVGDPPLLGRRIIHEQWDDDATSTYLAMPQLSSWAQYADQNRQEPPNRMPLLGYNTPRYSNMGVFGEQGDCTYGMPFYYGGVVETLGVDSAEPFEGY
jgi:hypothetical protein